MPTTWKLPNNQLAEIHCVACDGKMLARLTSGEEVYPQREDLWERPFWKCDVCGNYVGTHYKSSRMFKPLGPIPTPQLRKARMEIHNILDPLWQHRNHRMAKKLRRKIYQKISKEIGYEYHTAHLKSIEEARKVYVIIRNIWRSN